MRRAIWRFNAALRSQLIDKLRATQSPHEALPLIDQLLPMPENDVKTRVALRHMQTSGMLQVGNEKGAALAATALADELSQSLPSSATDQGEGGLENVVAVWYSAEKHAAQLLQRTGQLQSAIERMEGAAQALRRLDNRGHASFSPLMLADCFAQIATYTSQADETNKATRMYVASAVTAVSAVRGLDSQPTNWAAAADAVDACERALDGNAANASDDCDADDSLTTKQCTDILTYVLSLERDPSVALCSVAVTQAMRAHALVASCGVDTLRAYIAELETVLHPHEQHQKTASTPTDDTRRLARSALLCCMRALGRQLSKEPSAEAQLEAIRCFRQVASASAAPAHRLPLLLSIARCHARIAHDGKSADSKMHATCAAEAVDELLSTDAFLSDPRVRSEDIVSAWYEGHACTLHVTPEGPAHARAAAELKATASKRIAEAGARFPLRADALTDALNALVK